MRSLMILTLAAMTLAIAACGGSPNVTIVNECPEPVNVQIKSSLDATFTFNGIEPGEEDGGDIGLGTMDVKAVFPKGKMEATTGFRSEEGGEYKLIIRGDPPGIFLELE